MAAFWVRRGREGAKESYPGLHNSETVSKMVATERERWDV